jgi:hypothetical protein
VETSSSHSPKGLQGHLQGKFYVFFLLSSNMSFFFKSLPRESAPICVSPWLLLNLALRMALQRATILHSAPRYHFLFINFFCSLPHFVPLILIPECAPIRVSSLSHSSVHGKGQRSNLRYPVLYSNGLPWASVRILPFMPTLIIIIIIIITTPWHSPRANYTDRATAACRRSYCQFLQIKSVVW